MGMGVWVYGCMGAWVHSAWVYGCMLVYACMGAYGWVVWVYGCMGAWMHGCMGVCGGETSKRVHGGPTNLVNIFVRYFMEKSMLPVKMSLASMVDGCTGVRVYG